MNRSRTDSSSLNDVRSWVIRDKATKTVVCETFSRAAIAALNVDRYEAVPILQYLGEMNAQIRRAKEGPPS